MQHVLKIHVFDNPANPELILVADRSIYDPSLPISNRLLEVTIPGASDIRLVPFPKGNLSIYDSVILELFNSDCPSALPDGSYSFRYSMTPNDSLYTKVYHFRVSVLMNKIMQYIARTLVVCDDGIDDCGNVILTKAQNILMHAHMLALSAESVGRDSSTIDWAYDLYKKAEADLSIVEKILQ